MAMRVSVGGKDTVNWWVDNLKAQNKQPVLKFRGSYIDPKKLNDCFRRFTQAM